MSKQERIIAVFDFDGTITTKSTTSAFMHYVLGMKYYILLTLVSPMIVLHKLNLINIDRLNNSIIRYLKGYNLNFLLEKGRQFSQFEIDKFLRKEALQKIKHHQSLGHFCILATAAYDIYIESWGKLNNFDAVVSTKLEFDKNNCATGRMLGITCNNAEKVVRIKEVIGEEVSIIYAYGDSKGDKEMLAFATYPFYRSFDKLYDAKKD